MYELLERVNSPEDIKGFSIGQLRQLCGEIRDGHVEAAPRGSGDDTACRYCDYRTICHARRGDERPRDK